MKPTDFVRLLEEFARDKAALRRRHESVARVARQYDLNNAYQYVLEREAQHATWLRDAIIQSGGAPPEPAPLDALEPPKDDGGLHALARADAEDLDRFVSGWADRTSAVSHARHRLMLDLILGETREQARLFHQAAAGGLDLLGRRTGGRRTPGQVLPTRWVE